MPSRTLSPVNACGHMTMDAPSCLHMIFAANFAFGRFKILDSSIEESAGTDSDCKTKMVLLRSCLEARPPQNRRNAMTPMPTNTRDTPAHTTPNKEPIDTQIDVIVDVIKAVFQPSFGHIIVIPFFFSFSIFSVSLPQDLSQVLQKNSPIG